MPRRQSKVPSYCLHKASGQAVVRLDGRDRYLGPHGSLESVERYERAIAEWRIAQVARATPPPVPHRGGQDLTINDLLLRYLDFAE